MAEKKVVIDIEVNNRAANESVRETIDSVGRLRRELAQLNAQAEDLEKGTDAFRQLEAQIKKTEREIKKAESAFGDATDRIRTLTGSGVERATASFGLLKEGITNLDFGKFKIGVEGVSGSFKALGGAIAATGIGLLVIGVTQLIANFDKLKASGGLLGEVLTFIGNTISDILGAIEDLADAIGLIDKEEQNNALKREERSKKFIENEQKKKGAVEDRYNKEIALLKSLGKDTDELEIKSLKAQKAVVDNQISRIKAFQETTSLFDKVLGPELEKLLKDQDKLENDIQVKQNERNVKAIESAKERAEKQKKIDKDRLDALAAEASADLDAKERGRLAGEKFLADQKAIDDKRLNDLAALADAELDNTQRRLDAEKAYTEDIKAENKKRLENERELQSLKLAAVSDGLFIISNLTETFAGQSEKQQKRAFNIQKGVSIAQAAIATYESATKSYNALAGIPVVGPILGGVAAAAAVTAGLLNIKKISSQKFEGGGERGQTSAPSPNLNSSAIGGGSSSTSQVVPSSFSLFGTGGNANNLGGANQPQLIQAYVVESDISSVQRRVERFRTASEL
jgi:hypothetical protein